MYNRPLYGSEAERRRAQDQKFPGGTRCKLLRHAAFVDQTLLTRNSIQYRARDQYGRSDVIANVFPIAGEPPDQGGKYIDARWTRLKTSKLDTDTGKEGVRLSIQCGFKKVDGKNGDQKGLVEFICNKDLEGDEHLWDPEKYEGGNTKREE